MDRKEAERYVSTKCLIQTMIHTYFTKSLRDFDPEEGVSFSEINRWYKKKYGGWCGFKLYYVQEGVSFYNEEIVNEVDYVLDCLEEDGFIRFTQKCTGFNIDKTFVS